MSGIDASCEPLRVCYLRSSAGRADRIRLIAIETMKGAFGNEGALRFIRRTDGVSLDFLRRSGSTFSTARRL